jgi:NAD(P)-dependent dehydrogenase (short-subunit alcohol dehydrogenase family)
LGLGALGEVPDVIPEIGWREADWCRELEQLQDRKGAVTHLIFAFRHRSDIMSTQEIDHQILTTYHLPEMVVQALLKVQDGSGDSSKLSSIVFTSSPVANFASLQQPHSYHYAKGGELALARSFALRFGPSGIRVNSVLPGFIRRTDVSPSLRDPHLHGQMLKTPLCVESVAESIVWLGCSLARAITAAEIYSDAGSSKVEIFSAIFDVEDE